MTIVGNRITNKSYNRYPVDMLGTIIREHGSLSMSTHPWRIGWFMPVFFEYGLPGHVCHRLDDAT